MTWFKTLITGALTGGKIWVTPLSPSSSLTSGTNKHNGPQLNYVGNEGDPTKVHRSIQKVTLVVEGTNKWLKCMIFKKGLRLDCMFQEKLGLERVCSLSDLLNTTQPYIKWKELLLKRARKIRDPKVSV